MLEFYWLFPNLYFGERTILITIKTQHRKNIDKLPQYTDDNVSFHIFRLRLPLNLFYAEFEKVYEYSLAGFDFAQYKFNQKYNFTFLQKSLSVFQYCINCHMHTYKNMKENKTAILPFSKLSKL